MGVRAERGTGRSARESRAKGATLEEADLIDLLRLRLGGGRRAPEGIGDDAAVLRESDGRVVTVDAMVEGVHFDLAWSDWYDVGWKLFARNASDVFAMNARPTAWVLAMTLRSPVRHEELERLVEGMRAAARRMARGAALVGGDSASSRGPHHLAVTMVGRALGGVTTRAGARPGQGLWVDGPIGLAEAGRRILAEGREPTGAAAADCVAAHRRPCPRPPRAGELDAAGATAAIDVSDGLAIDLWRLARASRVGLVLEGPFPGWDTVRRAREAGDAGVGGDSEAARIQLAGGDDYVRVVAAARSPGRSWRRIGEVVKGPPSLTLRGADGTRVPLSSAGFRHFWTTGSP